MPSYDGSRVDNTTPGFRIGSTAFWKSPTYQPATNPSEFIAKQVPCQADSCSKQEPNVRTLWPETRMMVSPLKLVVHSATPKQISRSANPSHLKTGKLETICAFVGILAKKLTVLFLEGDGTGALIVPALDVRSQVLSVKDRRNGVGKPVFKLAPIGNGQVFAFTAPDLRVPGIPG